MGASGSSPVATRHHSLLTKLSGLQGIDREDVFYQHLLAGSPVSSAEPVAVQSFLEPYCEQLGESKHHTVLRSVAFVFTC